MNESFLELIKKSTGASAVFEKEMIQSLWSGYGKILRYGLQGSELSSVVIKHVKLPDEANHPRGWNSDISHQRKLKSYQVETAWYKNWSKQCDDFCRVPQCLGLKTQGEEVMIILEDLDASGYASRKSTVGEDELAACIKWLANFHATFLEANATDLWEQGTYWHLATRPDELEVLEDQSLKKAAVAIDKKLSSVRYKTLVHGDAKLANFCFSENGKKVSAVDFQYVGAGCGMKDLAYFIGSCLYEEDCERLEQSLLKMYFEELRTALARQGKEVDLDELEREWRELYPVAWVDFHRFLKGWSPGHWKINSYSERLVREVVANLDVT